MADHHSNGKLQDQKINSAFPKVMIDRDSDFASIKIAYGVESESFVKDGIVFCTNKDGDVIEIQILNLSQFGK
jgi:hypothetical protein